ncbi:MAG: DUF3459 domain-containing protein [Rhodobacteraceae bacterium]|nr:DUF3459 domain-containing protein [Paracoccaceae bacterium]
MIEDHDHKDHDHRATWWQRGVIYQIYPRSFQDSNGDGVGDLAGILARLDYLQWLGVDAVWISPVYPSPMADFGYDVSDYCNIDPLFGTMADFDALADAIHARSLKLIMDLVPNHTSDRHPWFNESRASRENPKRDWYVWRDAKRDGAPPNNWLSEFGGPAWTWDAHTQQYYYHAYLSAQPDLNWRNPDVRAAFDGILKFWFDRGVDGFRIDTVQHLFEDESLRDNPPNPDWRPGDAPTAALSRLYTTDRPELWPVLKHWRQLADIYQDRVLISEAYVPVDKLAPYYGDRGDAVHLPFNFHLIGCDWSAGPLADLIARYERMLPPHGWPNWVLGNHDRARIASRVGPAQAANAAMLLLTLRGTPTMYYGDELGMTNVAIPPDQVRDPWEKNVAGYGLGRDPVRTPMAWDTSANAGFSPGLPWLPVHADWKTRNVDAQRSDPASLLNLTRALLALRRRESALSIGGYDGIWAAGPVLCYVRQSGARRILVCLNLADRAAHVALPGRAIESVLLTTDGPPPFQPNSVSVPAISLSPNQGIVALLKDA